MLKYLIEKEFKQFLRNSFLPRLVVGLPMLSMLVFPWAVNMEITNLNVAVVDHDHSPYSSRLIQKINATDYFHLIEVVPSFEKAMTGIEKGTIDLILEIPQGFDRDLMRENKGAVLIAVNTVSGTKGGLGNSYMAAIINAFSNEIRKESAGTLDAPSSPVIEVIPQNKFNPHMNYKLFMIPGLMVILMSMLCGFLPALNIVSEKEIGTIEQINVSPVNKLNFILAKLIPYWVIGFFVFTVCFGIVWLVYGLLPVGSMAVMYLGAIVFALCMSGLGLIISNHSNTMQQAMFVIFFFMIVFMLTSGLFTPINSMPRSIQVMTAINPLKYFVHIMRGVYLKGSSLSDVSAQLLALTGFALAFNCWAILSYRKKS